MSEQQLLLARVEPALELELVDGAIADEAADIAVIAAPAAAAAALDPSSAAHLT